MRKSRRVSRSRRWLAVAAVSFVVSVCSAGTLKPAPAIRDGDPPGRPSIVFILIDDMGWTDVGCFGSTYYDTPNIDRLCREGMKFTSAYTNGPNCAPTRACLMSGQYSPRHGIYTVGTAARGLEKFRRMVPVENRTVLPAAQFTLAEALREAGYRTAHMGKWHLGDAPRTGPLQQGFDLNVGGDHRGHPPTYFSPYRNPHLRDGPEGEYLTDRLTDEALKFIESSRDGPFFLYLAHFAVHTPIQAKKSVVEKYRGRQPPGRQRNATYAAMVDSVDESVGRILRKLEELAIAKRTLVIFYSDNGGVGGYEAAGVQGARDITDNHPLRGGKGMLYEGGVRVPLIVRWPGVTKAGSVCDVPVISVDFYPTLVELAGARVPGDQILDGKSLLTLMKTGEDAALSSRALYWHFPAYLQASVRKGTWRTTPAGAIRSGDHKLIEFFEDGRVELYDLRTDIGETTNLAAKLPDRTAELHRRLEDWRREMRAAMPTRKKNGE